MHKFLWSSIPLFSSLRPWRLLAISLLVAEPFNAPGATLTWYADGANPGGSGNWNYAGYPVAPWRNYLGNFQGWVDSPSTALFGGPSGTYVVTINASGMSAQGGIIFQSGGSIYTVTSLTLGLGSGSVTTDSNATINSELIDIGSGSSLVKMGTATLTLGGSNSYSGATYIDAGTLAISSDGNLGATSGALHLNGGTLRANTTFSLSSARPVNLDGDGYVDTNGNSLAIPGTISGNGNLFKEGSGTVSISGTKIGTGEIYVSGGTLQISSSFTTGSSSFASAVGYGGTGILTQTGGTSTYNSGSLVVGYDATGTYNLENDAALVAANDLYVGDTGQGTFNQSGTSSATVYGTLYVDPGVTGSRYNLSAGTLTTEYTDNYGTITQTGGTHYAVGTVAYSLTNEVGATYTLSGGTVGTYGSLNGGSFTQSNGSTHIIVGTFYNYAGAHYTLSGTGSTLDVDDSDSDASAVNNGTFTETGGTAYLMNLSGDGTFSLSGGVLSLSGASNSLDSLTFTLSGGTLATTVDISTSASITLNSGGGTFDVASGTSLTLSHSISGAGGLAKANAGTLTLSAAAGNTFSGGATISDGTLLVSNTSNSATGAGNVTLNGGIFGGAGTITGTLIGGSAAHTIAPSATLSGNTATTLTVGGLTTSAYTTLAFNLNTPFVGPSTASVNDRICVKGTVDLTNAGATLSITHSNTGQSSLGYYKAIGYTALTLPISPTANLGITMPAVANGVSYVLDLAHDPGYIDIHRGFLGDANDDGTVNAIDLGILATNFNSTTANWSLGDFNGDGDVNAIDLGILATNFNGVILSGDAMIGGETFLQALKAFPNLEAAWKEMVADGEAPAVSSGFAGISAVPEPGSLALLGIGAGVLLGRRRGVRIAV